MERLKKSLGVSKKGGKQGHTDCEEKEPTTPSRPMVSRNHLALARQWEDECQQGAFADPYSVDGYSMSEQLGVEGGLGAPVQFYDFPLYQREFPLLCATIHLFIIMRADRFCQGCRDGEIQSREDMLAARGNPIGERMTNEIYSQSLPRLVQSSSTNLYLTASYDRRITMEKLKEGEQAKYQQWVFTDRGFIENVGHQLVLESYVNSKKPVFLSWPSNLDTQRWLSNGNIICTRSKPNEKGERGRKK
eukprot:TRINITY_DN5303_c0_g1_i7.p1 TRINITY_DN5303_c0_g1~~TRINITY_DN5303_c0_g1_i7.p1  ORF type:complete len:247 (+),score=37.57 TRINITY_DN5303_c0_g1_i7:183-923(+)